MTSFDQDYHTVRLHNRYGAIEIVIDRPEAGNSINATLVDEISAVLQALENDNSVGCVILSAAGDHFCSGMDFSALLGTTDESAIVDQSNRYFELLVQMTTSSKAIVCVVDGQVDAGGIGLVAASDIVIATEQASFGLSEALFGLLPACLLPVLSRRLSHQKAQYLAMTTQRIDAACAHRYGLVDELADDARDALRKSMLRLRRITPETIGALKRYMNQLCPLDTEIKNLAVSTSTALMRSAQVRGNISKYMEQGIFPWQAP